jgi:hypothetical protein
MNAILTSPARTHTSNDLLKVSPVECNFKRGDTVTYTIEYGVEFNVLKVIGFSEPEELHGRFIHLDKESWWFPVHEHQLQLKSNKVH